MCINKKTELEYKSGTVMWDVGDLSSILTIMLNAGSISWFSVCFIYFVLMIPFICQTVLQRDKEKDFQFTGSLPKWPCQPGLGRTGSG